MIDLNNNESIIKQISSLYQKILLREPDKEGLEFWSSKIINEKLSIEEVKQEFFNSKEYEQIDQKYNFSNQKEPPKGFFDDYPRFFSTSKTVPHPNHLNGRFKAIIECNLKIIKNSSILDIGSHDGRWSFAALKKGAKQILGIEAREHLVNNAFRNMKAYGINGNSYNFIANDISLEIKKLQPNQFDVIFCLGFLYHTIDHWNLLSEIKRLNPRFVIIDTRIDLSNERIIKLHVDYPGNEAHAVSNEPLKKEVLVATPSKPALETMLTCLGFSNFQYFDWKKNIKNFRSLVDYYHGKRVTLVASLSEN